MINRKSILIFIAILALSVLLFTQFVSPANFSRQTSTGTHGTQSQQNGKTGTGTDKTELRAAVSMTAREFDYFRSQTESYAKEHGMAITLENIPASEAYAKLKKASQMGEAPDIMLVDNEWVNEFAALGFLHPVDEYFTSEQQAQRLPTMMNQVKWNGYLWGIPKDVNPYVLVWNKKVAADNKWDHAPASREEMIAWNKAMMKPEEGKYGIYFDPSDDMALISAFTSLMEPVPETGHPLEKVNDPVYLKTLQSFLVPQSADWDAKAYAANFPVSSGGGKVWDQLKNGKMAAVITTISDFRQNRSPDLALAALPLHSTGKTSGAWLKGRSFCLSSHSVNNDAAMDWIKALTTEDAEKDNWKNNGNLPVLISTYTTAQLKGEEQYSSYLWLVREGRVLPFEIDAAKKLDQLVKERRLLEQGSTDLKTFAEQVAKLWKPSNSGKPGEPSPSDKAADSPTPTGSPAASGSPQPSGSPAASGSSPATGAAGTTPAPSAAAGASPAKSTSAPVTK